MRKVLLATTALIGVALAGSAHAAASSPISLNVGGYNDFVAGLYSESQGIAVGPTGAAASSPRSHHDFEDEFKISFDAMGKASNGIEYGANISLWNGPEVTNAWAGGANGVTVNSAYVWMSGAFGKVLLGDEHGASDLFVYAPTVGEGQLDGRYMDFTSPFSLARIMPSGIDNTEHSTKITYYTPKVGNDANKVQLGVSYIPNMYDYGSNVTKFYAAAPAAGGGANGQANSPYQDVVKAAVEYWGNWHPVHAALSAQLIEGQGSTTGLATTTIGGAGAAASATPAGKAMAFGAWGLGGQLGIDQVAGLTLGASYNNLGHYDAVHGQNKNQQVFDVGAKYEFDKIGVAVNYLNGSEYDNMLLSGAVAGTTANDTNYVSNFNGYGAGATYTWFPGLTSAADLTFFTQGMDTQVDTAHNDGYVFLVSQKLTF